MRIFLSKDGRIVNWIEGASAAELQPDIGSNYLCIDDPSNGMRTGWELLDGAYGPPRFSGPRTLALADLLRRIPNGKRRAIRAALSADAVLNDAWALMHTYTEVDLDDRNVIDFTAFLSTNGNLTGAEATALLI